MNYSSKDFHFKKHLGQNFLIDQNLQLKIANAVNAENQLVVEIGCGNGSITQHIIKQNPKMLICIEKDIDAYNILIERFSTHNNIRILNIDINEYNFESLFEEFTNNDVTVCGNLPYNIGTRIVIDMTKYSHKISKCVFMLQKEVVQKICANIDSKDFGISSGIVNSFYDTKFLFNVSKNCFVPKPNVESAVFEMKRSDKVIKNIANRDEIISFFKIVCQVKKRNIAFLNKDDGIKKNPLIDNMLKFNHNDKIHLCLKDLVSEIFSQSHVSI